MCVHQVHSQVWFVVCQVNAGASPKVSLQGLSIVHILGLYMVNLREPLTSQYIGTFNSKFIGTLSSKHTGTLLVGDESSPLKSQDIGTLYSIFVQSINADFSEFRWRRPWGSVPLGWAVSKLLFVFLLCFCCCFLLVTRAIGDLFLKDGWFHSCCYLFIFCVFF